MRSMVEGATIRLNLERSFSATTAGRLPFHGNCGIITCDWLCRRVNRGDERGAKPPGGTDAALMTRAPSPKSVGDGRGERSFLVHGATIPTAPLAPGLYVVATPIGNLADVTLRALSILAGADAILAEDTRVSRTLLARYGIDTPLSPYHEHNAAEARPRALRRIGDGQALALISDAGTPLISDPGYQAGRGSRRCRALR